MNLQQAVVYLPQDRRSALARGIDLPDRTKGVALFADVSGFTPLAEALVRAFGTRRGAEALLRQLDQLFEALIAQLDHWGGSVISFAGDAITCWIDDASAPNGSSTGSALACAIQMEKAMRQFSAIQIPGQSPVSLALKVTAAYGPARRFLVGDSTIQRIDTLAGKTLERMAGAESLAKRGEVVVDEATAAGWPVLERRTHPESGEVYCVIEQSDPVFASFEVSATHPVEEWEDRFQAVIRPYVLPATWERIEVGMGELMTELRPAAALFLRFTGIDYDGDEAAGAKLDAFIRRAQMIMSTYDGTLLQVSIGDKGSYFYASFGAPVAHEDDMLRAVRAAMDLRAAVDLRASLPGLVLPAVQIGVSQGVMHTGSYGSSTRRTYGVIGDDVNTSARLMSKAAPGEILVGSRVRNATVDSIAYEPRAPVLLKGKSEPMPVFAATAAINRHSMRLEEPSYALPMIGRQQQLAAIEARLEMVLKGQGQVIGISGEPGMGKSRLAAELVRAARKKGLAGYGGACQSVSASYQVWKTIWQGFFGIDPEAPLRRQLRNLEGEIEDRAPDRVDAMPLLGPVLGIAIPDNDFTTALAPQERQSALEALLLDCLAAEAKQAAEDDTGLLLVLEDLHWIDPASMSLLEAVVGRIMDLPVLVALVYRPLGLRGTVSALSFAQQPNFSEVTLNELNPQESALVIRAKLAQLYPERSGAVPPALIERISARAQGNPFYLEELLNFIHDRDIALDDPDAILSVELPAELHSLVLSRIDQFTTKQQITLKAASVIGRLFRFAHLSGYYPALQGGDRPLQDDLQTLAQFELTPLYGQTPELEYLFKHIITREVAYETLPFAIRASLHEQYAQFIEDQEQDKLAQPADSDEPQASLALLDLLAHHYGLSENTAKQKIYFRRAADAAAHAFANAAAVSYYTRLIPLLDENGKQEARLLLARVHRLTGDWENCEEVLQEGRRYAELAGERLILARFQSAMGDMYNKRGAPEKALEWQVLAQPAFEEKGARADLCDALIISSESHWLLGRYAAALADVEKCQAAAHELNDPARLMRAMGQAGMIYNSSGDLDMARNLGEQTYDMAQTLGDRRAIINALNNTADILVKQGDYLRGLDSFGRAYTAAFEIGSRLQMSITAGNLGYIYLDYGDLQAAQATNQHSLMLSLYIGDYAGVALALWGLGRIFATEGSQDGLEMLDQAVILGRALEMPYELCEFLLSRAVLLAQTGRYMEAHAANDEARRVAEQVGRDEILFQCDTLTPVLRLALGEIDAQAASEALRAMLDTWSDPRQQADLHYQIWKIDPSRQASRDRAAELYTQLHEQTALLRYRTRCQELNGALLEAPALPALPSTIPPSGDLRHAREQVKELIRKKMILK